MSSNSVKYNDILYVLDTGKIRICGRADLRILERFRVKIRPMD